jgi:O-antigen ligase
MPPSIALLLCFSFILALLRLEKNRESNVSGALWIPLIWMIITGSRFVSQWINPHAGGGSVEDGSPVDRVVFFGLIIGGILVLSRRKIPWSQTIGQNLPLILFLGYCGISITWSDFPFVAFKRWIKEIGNLVMVLVVLSEADSIEAVKTVLRKLGYFLLPLSIVFIKYFPEYGRGFSQWTGEAYNCGVGLNKNYLGFICLACGVFYLWCLSEVWRNRAAAVGKRTKIIIYILFLSMVFWLFDKANSATSLMCFIAGGCILIGLKITFVKRNLKSFGIIAILIFLGLFVLQVSLHLDQVLIGALGRNSSLTDRIPLWGDILSFGTNPLIGLGYNSFFLGDRAERLWEKWNWHPNSTHNGYLDTYVNLGWIGIVFLTILLISTFAKAKNELLNNYEYGRFRMGWLVVVLLYNFTETAFSGLHLVWLIFLLIAVDYPRTVVKDSSSSNDFAPLAEAI